MIFFIHRSPTGPTIFPLCDLHLPFFIFDCCVHRVMIPCTASCCLIVNVTRTLAISRFQNVIQLRSPSFLSPSFARESSLWSSQLNQVDTASTNEQEEIKSTVTRQERYHNYSHETRAAVGKRKPPLTHSQLCGKADTAEAQTRKQRKYSRPCSQSRSRSQPASVNTQLRHAKTPSNRHRNGLQSTRDNRPSTPS